MNGKVSKMLRRLSLKDGKPLRALKRAWLSVPAPKRRNRRELEKSLGFKRGTRSNARFEKFVEKYARAKYTPEYVKDLVYGTNP